MRTVYRCPFEDRKACPRIEKYADDEVYIQAGCTIGPLARRTGDFVQTICRLVIDPEIVRGPEDLADSLDGFMVLAPGTREVVAKPRWIPVTERFPFAESGDASEKVLVTDGQYMAIAEWLNFEMSGPYWSYTGIGDITHWMPLPEPPMEGEK